MSLLDDLLKLLGTNRIRVSWKWRAFRERWTRWWRSAENRGRAFRYEGKTCAECQHPAGRDETKCVKCGGALVSQTQRNLGRVWGVLVPAGFPLVTALLCAACATLYVVTLKATYDALGDAAGGRYDPVWGILYAYGGLDAGAVREAGEYWRLVTACFLHQGPLHLGMNVIGLFIVGQTVEELFGRARTLFLFLATGVLGFVGSMAYHGTWYASAGASGAVYGLIGAIIGHALRFRGPSAQRLRTRFVPWLLYGLIFGLAMPAVDNAAHIAGFVAGLGWGALLGDTQQARRWPRGVWRAVAVICLAVVVASFVGAALQPQEPVDALLKSEQVQ